MVGLSLLLISVISGVPVIVQCVLTFLGLLLSTYPLTAFALVQDCRWPASPYSLLSLHSLVAFLLAVYADDCTALGRHTSGFVAVATHPGLFQRTT